MKVALYCRVSTLDQNPENQKIELLDYVKHNSDRFELFDVYEDTTSGAKDSRPALDRLMRDARARLFQHVIFWKVDRLGRNAVHVQTVANEWKNLGISFSISTLNLDTTTPLGEFIFGVMAQFAQMERALIVERTNLGLSRIKKELEKGNGYKAKSGRVITKLGRPKGSKDQGPRVKRGYVLRDYKKRTPRKKASFYLKEDNIVNNGAIVE
jgi:DNA invertase Pin-like site-specific DNA recombinase